MTVKMTVKKNWSNDILKGMDEGLLEIVTTIDRRAKILAPFDKGNLVNSALISKLAALAYQLSFGSNRVPYARIQELGGYTGRHYATRIKGKHYLRDAADKVYRGDMSKYFRGKV